MIGHATVGTRDLDRAKPFFDALLEPFGAKHARTTERAHMYMSGENIALVVCKPYNGEEATVGNGTMLAFKAPSKDAVNAVYDIALAQGGTCEGEPGARAPTFYAAYFRDLDGNKFCVFNRD